MKSILILALIAVATPAYAADVAPFGVLPNYGGPPAIIVTGTSVSGCAFYRMENPPGVVQVCDPNDIKDLRKDGTNARNYSNAFNANGAGSD